MSEIQPVQPAHTLIDETNDRLLVSTKFKRNASTWPIIASTILAAIISADSYFRSPTASILADELSPTALTSTWSAAAFVGFSLLSLYLVLAALTGREVLKVGSDRMRVGTSYLGFGPRGGFRLDKIESVTVGRPGADLESEVFDGHHAVLIETDRLRVVFGRRSGWSIGEATWVAQRVHSRLGIDTRNNPAQPAD